MSNRSRTIDRGPPAETARVVGTIGPKRQRLGNGFLLCRDVPVARTGWMMYQPGETPIKTRDNHPVAYVKRGDDQLFSPTTIGSLIAASVTIEHPAVDVTPANVQSLGKGYCLDARRGDGDDRDVLLADLIITDPHAIERIETMDRTGRAVEVSLGYEADYFQTAPGEGEQRNIIINHIALVDRGRCGPRCAIGDSDPDHPTASTKEQSMPGATTTRPRVKLNEARARVAEAVSALEEAEQEEEGEGIHVHVHTADADPGVRERTIDAETESRISGLETTLESMGETITELAGLVREVVQGKARTADADPDPQEGDSRALERGFQDFVSKAEVLVPGFKVPTFDSAAPRAKTVDSMCAGRRAVLAQFAALPDGKGLLDSVTGGELDLAEADCSAVAVAFNSAAALKGAHNNAHSTRDARTVPQGLPLSADAPRPSMSASQMNEANKKFWATQGQPA